MSEEEFEALGITPNDLVCIRMETLGPNDKALLKWVGSMLIDDIEHNLIDVYLSPSLDQWNYNWFCFLADIKSIEIIKKDFFNENIQQSG